MSLYAVVVNCPNCDAETRVNLIKPKTIIDMHTKFTCLSCRQRWLVTATKNGDVVDTELTELEEGE